ncbi:MAG: DUF928 domain-containing protein [Cyanobacteria bacterium J06560_6]
MDKQTSCRESAVDDELDSDGTASLNDSNCAVPEPPVGNGGPPVGGPGDGRPACSLEPDVRPLAPAALEENVEIEDAPRWSLTAQNRPSLWFYLPYEYGVESLGVEVKTLRPVEDGEIPEDVNITEVDILVDSDSFSTPNSTPDKAGIVKVVLSESLEPNRWYSVELTIAPYCSNGESNGESTSDFLLVWVMYKPLTDEYFVQLNQVETPSQRVALLTEMDYWHDAITEAATLNQEDITDPTLENLLRRIAEINREEEISVLDILNCCDSGDTEE